LLLEPKNVISIRHIVLTYVENFNLRKPGQRKFCV
jgi:hypothetical protein